MPNRLFFYLFLTGLLVPARLSAQVFGQNRLLVRDFPYKVWETDHFLIHYYEDNPLLMEETARYLEAAYDSITARLDAKPNKKLSFFLYTTHNEFEQNRIVNVGEGTGGVTEAFKDRFLIFHNGSMAWLKHVIFHEFAHEVQFAVLNAGFWKSARLLKTILYPLWMMEGMAEYMSGNIDATTDGMYARDAATSEKAPAFSLKDLHNFNHLKPNQITKAYKQGSFVMEYIAEEYGEDKIGQLLKSFYDRFDIGAVLLDVLGVDFERFDRNFLEWFEEKYGKEGLSEGLEEPGKYGSQMTRPVKPIPVHRLSPVLSPDGGRLYYLSMRQGFPAVHELDLKTGDKKILAGRNYGKLDWIGLEERNLAISRDGRYLYFVGEKTLKENLYRYDLKTKKLESRHFASLIGLQSPYPHPEDPDRVVLSGMEHGFNDIYIVDFKKGEILKRLNSDPQDDNHPVFTPDGESVIYSTEVGISSEGYPNRNLQIWNEKEGTSMLTTGARVEKTPWVSADGKKVLFISDASGVWDVYELELESGKAERKTRVIGGNFSPSYAPNGDIVFASIRHNEIEVYRGYPSAFLSEDATDIFKARPARRAPEISVFLREARAARSRFGTDLFLPAFFFSTQGGLFALGYWQGSDLLGYHNASLSLLLNSGAGAVDYSAAYTLSKYRPNLSLIFRGIQYQDPSIVSDRGEDLRRREHLQAFLASYPLTRHNRVETLIGVTERYNTFPSDPVAITNLQEFAVTAQFVRDTTTAPYLVVTRGTRLEVGAKRATPAADFDLDYLTSFGEWHQFIPFGTDSTLAARTAAVRSHGVNNQVFPLGGRGGVRGYREETDRNKSKGIMISNVEYRFPLFSDLNYHLWFMFPDFYFKNIYLGLFSDQGVRWNETEDLTERWKERRKDNLFHSVGVSVKINTFILEMFPFFFSIDWAKRTTSEGSIFYGSVGSFFTFGGAEKPNEAQ